MPHGGSSTQPIPRRILLISLCNKPPARLERPLSLSLRPGARLGAQVSAALSSCLPIFGGDPTALDEDFVASMSLNHAILAVGHKGFERELRDQQSADASFTAHCDYFTQPYAYGRSPAPERMFYVHLQTRAVCQTFRHKRAGGR